MDHCDPKFVSGGGNRVEFMKIVLTAVDLLTDKLYLVCDLRCARLRRIQTAGKMHEKKMNVEKKIANIFVESLCFLPLTHTEIYDVSKTTLNIYV